MTEHCRHREPSTVMEWNVNHLCRGEILDKQQTPRLSFQRSEWSSSNHLFPGRASSYVPQGPFKEAQNPRKRFKWKRFVQSRPPVLEALYSRVRSHTYAKIEVAHQRSSDHRWRYYLSRLVQRTTRQVEPCFGEGRLSRYGWCDQNCSCQGQWFRRQESV